jgi:hypothetical protein
MVHKFFDLGGLLGSRPERSTEYETETSSRNSDPFDGNVRTPCESGAGSRVPTGTHAHWQESDVET